jgi:septation ring formation regulator EzrA
MKSRLINSEVNNYPVLWNAFKTQRDNLNDLQKQYDILTSRVYANNSADTARSFPNTNAIKYNISKSETELEIRKRAIDIVDDIYIKNIPIFVRIYDKFTDTDYISNITQIQNEITKVQNEINRVRNEINRVQNENTIIQNKITVIQNKITEFTSDENKIRNEINIIQVRIGKIRDSIRITGLNKRKLQTDARRVAKPKQSGIKNIFKRFRGFAPRPAVTPKKKKKNRKRFGFW